jgi:hypothetical protein
MRFVRRIIFIAACSVTLVCAVHGLSFSEEARFDHGLYEKVLRGFVANGFVNYRALKENPEDLEAYIGTIGEFAPEALASLPRDERMAFYINAYNAFTLKAVIDYYPIRSIRSIPGVWDKRRFTIAGEEVTLNHVEHRILRKEFNEPRIHFTLVCASRGCPRLNELPFEGRRMESMLEGETRRFISDQSRNKIDRTKNILYLSTIFKWFKKDFGDVITYVSQYLPADDVRYIREARPVIRYRYDWTLNDVTVAGT